MKKVKKAKKPVAKKTVAVKVATKKKIISKRQSVTSKKPLQRLKRKKVAISKPLGLFAIVCGVIGLVVITVLGINSLVASNGASNSSVLGSTVITSIPAPKNVNARVTSSGVKVSWTYSEKADGYNIWRKKGLFGEKVRIAMNYSPIAYVNGVAQDSNSNPLNYYVDSSVSKNSIYTYYISALYSGGVSSKQASSNIILNTKSVTQYSVFSIASKTASTISINGLIDPSKVYFVNVSNQQNTFNRTYSFASQQFLDRISYKFYTYPAMLSYYSVDSGGRKTFNLTNLIPGGKYYVSISAATATGFESSSTDPRSGMVYETRLLQNEKSITTSSKIIAPAIPSGFRFVGMVNDTEASFLWNVPTLLADGYTMDISCSDQSVTGVNITQPVNVYTTTNTVQLGFTLPRFGNNRGNCTATLKAYNNASTDRDHLTLDQVVYSNPVTLTFKN